MATCDLCLNQQGQAEDGLGWGQEGPPWNAWFSPALGIWVYFHQAEAVSAPRQDLQDGETKLVTLDKFTSIPVFSYSTHIRSPTSIRPWNPPFFIVVVHEHEFMGQTGGEFRRGLTCLLSTCLCASSVWIIHEAGIIWVNPKLIWIAQLFPSWLSQLLPHIQCFLLNIWFQTS